MRENCMYGLMRRGWNLQPFTLLSIIIIIGNINQIAERSLMYNKTLSNTCTREIRMDKLLKTGLKSRVFSIQYQMSLLSA